MTKERLAEQFKEARDAAGHWLDIPSNQKAPTFHEIRSLADKLADDNNFELDAIQEAMAHSDVSQTLAYQANQESSFKNVDVAFTKGMLGRGF